MNGRQSSNGGKLMNSTTNIRGNLKSELAKNVPLFSMLVPGFILAFLFSYLPMFGIVIAFKKYQIGKSIWEMPWTGLKNFEFLFTSSNTPIFIRNTILYNLVFIFVGLVLNVGLAIMLSEIREKIISKTYQTIILMPHFLSYVIISYIVLAFLNVEHGYINTHIMPLFGKEAVNWYANPKPWPFILILVHFWKSIGYNSIVYLAAIAGIDTELYEAAEIDGANKWQKITNITIPSLKMLMIIMTILAVGKIFSADFGLFYQTTMDSGALYPTTLVINTYTYNMLGQGGATGIGLASAASFFQSVMGFILVLTTNYIVNKIDSESAMF